MATILWETNIQDQMEVLSDLVRDISAVDGGVRLATFRALKKTMAGAKTLAGKAVREEYAVRHGDVLGTMRVHAPTMRNLRAVLALSGSASLPLMCYSPLPKVPGMRPKGGVSVRIKTKGGRKRIASGFVARMASGHVGVFRRTGAEPRPMVHGRYQGRVREPINELFGPSFLEYLEREAVQDRLTDGIEDRLWGHLEHEADYILQKEGLR